MQLLSRHCTSHCAIIVAPMPLHHLFHFVIAAATLLPLVINVLFINVVIDVVTLLLCCQPMVIINVVTVIVACCCATIVHY